ncbi:MAG: bifunctional 5,10-methylenetetrahydrofolate dehydrogenase/5,10-methenyltetrahydrofolate cyclohydrolase [Candidatus Yanofskybacteria bacterium]|nr:bifunctional 5,10-methylenetetrahydrofolate dehydrogenase/5,10-methenyltetrahydrofolate cyclohydrolase [Candidatus Yanofskybacteria bacterium]
MKLIDGKQISEQILQRLERDVRVHAKPLQLAAVLVSDDPGLEKFVRVKQKAGLEKFVRVKQKAAEKIGIDFALYKFDPKTDPEEVVGVIEYLNLDEGIHGILIELPLPEHYDRQRVLDAVALEKDVDALSSSMQEKFYSNSSVIVPPAVRALQIVLQEHHIEIKNKAIAVFGQGLLIGQPITYWLKEEGAHVDTIDIDTKSPEEISQKADIIISGVGKAGLITEAMVREGAIVIDYGYENLEGRPTGDVDFGPVSAKAELITPVPGGMGPIVVASVLENLLLLNTKQA